jgi:hypothetical protein
LRGCSGPGLRQRTAARPPRPGHSLWGYMQPALASTSVEVAQTSGGCDSRRRARQENPPPPRLALESRQPLCALELPHWGTGGSFAPQGGDSARAPRGSTGKRSTTYQYARAIAVSGSLLGRLLLLVEYRVPFTSSFTRDVCRLAAPWLVMSGSRAAVSRDGTCEVRSTAWRH